MFSKHEKQVSNVDTVIGSATKFEGNLDLQASIRIDGDFKGNISCDGDVVIGAEGKVEADVTGRDLTVAGQIDGNVHASGTLRIEATGAINGDITMGVLVIDEGGTFTGRSNMISNDSKKTKSKQDSQNEEQVS
ncbi:cytoskeletal protein CcmA (bactofilin family) [Alkalibacillus filiformis]|uniref:Cytoskeletal protein CcmA (Bactofilin family) n=1 Tax=Alkalibacillus filiformis TaxID=200990 RepID=A0ABU0DSW9_9BACI|nr:polymer-forming cytoskeletal protein [Alkalibacillus filiformis]MDQ0351557.1 cytoskeletal protein CcmA (bactofilin family) [Alkalibacillus filiformis]